MSERNEFSNPADLYTEAEDWQHEAERPHIEKPSCGWPYQAGSWSTFIEDMKRNAQTCKGVIDGMGAIGALPETEEPTTTPSFEGPIQRFPAGGVHAGQSNNGGEYVISRNGYADLFGQYETLDIRAAKLRKFHIPVNEATLLCHENFIDISERLRDMGLSETMVQTALEQQSRKLQAQITEQVSRATPADCPACCNPSTPVYDAPHYWRPELDGEPSDYSNDIFTTTTPNPAGEPSALDVQVGGDHYKKYAIQPIEFFIANGIGYTEGAIIKYVLRHQDKNGREDLEKAKHLIDILIETYYSHISA